MAKSYNFPAEICLQVLDSIWRSDVPAVEKYQALCNARLVNRTWSHSASDIFFHNPIIYGSRFISDDLRRLASLKKLPENKQAALIKALTVELSLYGDCDDEESMDHFQDLFEVLSDALPESVPRLQGLEELHLLLLGRNDTVKEAYGGEDCAVIDYAFPQISDERPFEYVRSIGRALSEAPLPNLRALTLDLFTMCDLSTIIQESNENTSGENYFYQNISDLRELSITHNVLMCAGLDECRPETYHDELSGTFPYDLACRPYPLIELFNYGLPKLESLTIDCPELQKVCVDLHEILTTVPFENLRSIHLHKVYISIETLMSILGKNRKIQEMEIHWTTENPAERMKEVTNTIESMPELRRARIVTAKNTISYNRAGSTSARISDDGV